MSAMRMLFLMVSIALFAGIWLTGYQTIHWIIYIPAVALMFAGLTGICPGMMLLKKVGFK